MKITLVASALASFLVLYGNVSFSVDILSDINIEKKQIYSMNEKDILKTKDENKEYNRLLKVGRALVSGQAISYMWSSSDKYRNLSDISGDIDDWGMNYDAILRLGAEIKSNDSGIKYGADFQVSMPSVKGKDFERKAALNRGSRIFASTPYGDFSAGYQEGVESIMKLDSSNIIAGDESNSWTQHIRGALFERKNALGYSMYPFLFSAGLYSENIFRNNDNMVHTIDSDKDFINNLPFRMSYQSPNFMGLRFGVSYSPLGYKFEHFGRVLKLYTTNVIDVINKIPDFDVTMPSPGTVDLSTLVEKLKTANLTGTLTLKQDKNTVPNLKVKFNNKDKNTEGKSSLDGYIPCEGKLILQQDGTALIDTDDSTFYFGIEGSVVEMEIPASNIELKDLTIKLSDLEGVGNLSVSQDGKISITPKDIKGNKSSVIQRLKNTEDEIFFGAKYEHILSGSIAYDYDFNNNLKFSTSVVGEYARPRLYFNTKNHYNIYPESYNLQGVSIGSILSYKNVNFAAAYGYLGQSGFVKHYIAHNSAGNTETSYPMYERSSTYYWDMALGYQYKSSYVSVAYFKSNRSDNILQDISLGFEYNLLKERSKMKCKLFGNYHHYKFSEVSIIDSVTYDDGTETPQATGTEGSATNTGKGIVTRSVAKNKKNGSGNIFLVGAKLEF
ncbi:hypothetical protein [Ehrlichia japonica]|uniref:Gram-negative porin family protein n=1 Tax=Ehrlichia japonica TaxID=391036 RepID=X5GJE5_9RICK|nr:hypothetical protein [Ehrlichia japonica]AHX04548.1 hypothetical protein EHF_0469 [Ehrlichia japonica]